MTKVQILSWNVENFFHPDSGGPRFDFTPHEGWTLERYQSKVERVAKALQNMLRLSQGVPCVVGLSEVENERVVNDLLARLPANLKMASDASFSREYLDCVLIYDSSAFDVVACKYNQMFERYPRGDVVRVDLRVRATGAVITVFTCHLKARPSNQYYTSMYRQAVCDDLQTTIWQMHGGEDLRNRMRRDKAGAVQKPESLVLDKNVVVMGDFNDEPFSSSVVEYLSASYDRFNVARQNNLDRVALYNCSWERLMLENPGSYYYEKSFGSPWSMLDQIIVSPSLINGNAGLLYSPGAFRVVQNLTCDDNGKPFRMNSWDENDNLVWHDGYSDHFPVEIELDVV